MSNARIIAITLIRDGYNLSTLNAVIMALQEDLNYSEEEAVNIAHEILQAAREL